MIVEILKDGRKYIEEVNKNLEYSCMDGQFLF